MRALLHTIAATCTLAAVSPSLPASAQVNQPGAAVATEPDQFSVIGVRLGMSPEEARAAIAQSGYRITYENTDTQTYAAALDAALRQRNPRHVGRPSTSRIRHFTVSGSNNERAVVSFIDTAEGNRLSNINLSVPADYARSSDMAAQVRTQYGRPTVVRDRLGSAFWCMAAELRCGRVGAIMATLEYNSDRTGHTLRLSNENAMNSERAASLSARVDQRYPR